MTEPKEDIHEFLRGYSHLKSADWLGKIAIAITCSNNHGKTVHSLSAFMHHIRTRQIKGDICRYSTEEVPSQYFTPLRERRRTTLMVL
jgi:hypothetical protein